MAARPPQVNLNDCYQLPLVGFGTNHTVSKSEIGDAVDAAFRVGYRLFETRNKLGNETYLGRALWRHPDLGEVFLRQADQRSRYFFARPGLLVWHNTPYLDMFIIDYPRERPANDETSETLKRQRKEAWQALEKIKEEGSIRSLGVSLYKICHLKEIESLGGSIPAVNQAHSALGQRSVGVVPRSVNPTHIEQNFMCFKLKLTSDEIKEVDKFEKVRNKPPSPNCVVKK